MKNQSSNKMVNSKRNCLNKRHDQQLSRLFIKKKTFS